MTSKLLLLLKTACAVGIVLSMSGYATAQLVYSTDFSADDYSQISGPIVFDDGTTTTTNEWFGSTNGVSIAGGDLTLGNTTQNRFRGCGVWLDTTGWAAGLVAVEIDVANFAAGADTTFIFRAYAATGVDALNTVSLDLHGGANTGALSTETGTATINTLGSEQTINANGTDVAFTFTYNGTDDFVALTFAQVNVPAGTDFGSASLDDLSVTIAPDTGGLLRGDVDMDGDVDFEDIPAFIAVLQAGVFQSEADCDCSTSVDFDDIPAFIAILSGNANDECRPAQPNIVLLLTDDLGWQDVKCYDIDDPSPYETPNIDALAAKGVMFWQAYSPAPTCSPSRCAIMSGQHPARAQKTHVQGGTPPITRNVSSQRMMDPWFSGRMPEEEVTLAEVLQANGYTTGHSGKWHMAISHNAFPNATDQGFDFTRASRGSRTSMQDRLTGFATDDAADPYRLDANGYPFHQTNDDALTFLKESKDKPFFLYYATWLVHAPIHTRSEAHLQKYAARMGIDPAQPPEKATPGQQNPFYGSMVQELDYYVGQVFDYLDETEDPRWPGHMLSENTYVIFTSDNGGMEGPASERYTDNNPLDRGKISAKEGGTRVPLVITGPGIAADVESNVMVNGLDFYPTVLSLTGITKPEGKNFDGCDLKPLLLGDATDGSLVAKADGSARDSMMWHFPHGNALESTIRIGDYKLIHNYDWRNNSDTEQFELFRLYDSTGGAQQRVDIEESNNRASSMPQRTIEMAAKLEAELNEMQASYPYYNPGYTGEMPNKDRVPSVNSHQQVGTSVTFEYETTDKSNIVRADLIYTLNGNETYEEWFRTPAALGPDGNVTAEIPSGATHYFLNLIDENQFLRSYPEPVENEDSFTGSAIAVLGSGE